MQPDPSSTRDESALSWPSSYRSSQLISPDRTLDLSRLSLGSDGSVIPTPLRLPPLQRDTIVEEDEEEKQQPPKELREPQQPSKVIATSDHFDRNSRPGPKLPAITYSLQTLVGQPPKRRRRGRELQQTLTTWSPETSSSNNSNSSSRNKEYAAHRWKKGNNELDKHTLYSNKQKKLLDILCDPMAGTRQPLQTTSKQRDKPTDPDHRKEKELVLRNFFLTGKMRRFEDDKAVLPSVYKEVLACKTKRKSYLNTVYTTQFVRERTTRSPDCYKRRFVPQTQCEFCDVMGNKYCAFCIEQKNRHFALGYESSFLPPLPAFQTDSDRQRRQQQRQKQTLIDNDELIINANDGLPYLYRE